MSLLLKVASCRGQLLVLLSVNIICRFGNYLLKYLFSKFYTLGVSNITVKGCVLVKESGLLRF